MTAVRTFAGALRARALNDPSSAHDVAVRLTDPEGSVVWSTLALWNVAARVGAGLRVRGVQAGERVLVLSPEVRCAVAAHLGAWSIGATPVHVGLPFRLTDPTRFIASLEQTARRVAARVMLVSPLIETFATPDERVISIAALLQTEADTRGVNPDELPAPDLVQLTSGSTGSPRAVVISHSKVLTHLDVISRALPPGPEASGVTWLPLYHDMGLIGGLLYPLHNRFPVHVMSPLVFQTRPMAWLEALAEARATHTAGPPSAYALVTRLGARAVAQGLRLDALRCAMVGAEPISPAVLRAFSSTFAECGFRPEAFFPVYGLAEATVAVTFPSPMTPTHFTTFAPDGARPVELTGVGAPLEGTSVRIVNEQGADVPRGAVGEVLVQSPTLLDRLEGDDAAQSPVRDGWLSTGDVGFVEGGSLFIAGRAKDVIIRGGQNVWPEPLERLVSTVEGVRPGCVAVVGLFDSTRQTEVLVVVAESKLEPASHAALSSRVREATQAHGVTVDRVVVVEPGWLPRTTSGKLRRAEVVTLLRAAAGEAPTRSP